MWELAARPSSNRVTALLEALPDDVAIAPHVVARIVADIGDGEDAIGAVLSVAAHLLPAQLAGRMALPECLPGMPGEDRTRESAAALPDDDRRLLTIAAYATSRTVDLLSAAADMDYRDLARAGGAGKLAFSAGRFAFRDARLRTALHAGYTDAACVWRERAGELGAAQTALDLLVWTTTPQPTRNVKQLVVDPSGAGTRWDWIAAGSAPTPLERASAVVGHAFASAAAGQVGLARRVVRRAAYWLPIGAVAGGAGVALARRLDIIVKGRVTPLATALERTCPARRSRQLRMASLVDQAIQAALNGDMERALVLFDLERERGDGASDLPLGGLNQAETRLLGERPGRRPNPDRWAFDVEPADARTPWLRAARSASPTPERFSAAAAGLSEIRSPYQRAHTELCAARAFELHGDEARARVHLVAASAEFAEAEAWAWRDFAEGWIASRPAFEEGALVASPPPEGPPDDASSPGEDLAPSDGWGGILTSRERDVAQLIAVGASNREAGRRLGLSTRTVEVHLSHIYRKLGIQTRVELAVRAHSAA